MCAVKVLNNSGRGSYSDVIAGVEHVGLNCGQGKKCVANMSLSGSKYVPLNDAVNNAVANGIAFAVAAGNDSSNACDLSPASAQSAITVGSTTGADETSWFTNYGSCVDIYAPGSSITAAWIGSNTATNTISGTSMASPHIAGIAAGILNAPSAVGGAGVLAELTSKYTTMMNIDCRSQGVGLATNMVSGCTESNTCQGSGKKPKARKLDPKTL
jgi:subtilisin family serine protease